MQVSPSHCKIRRGIISSSFADAFSNASEEYSREIINWHIHKTLYFYIVGHAKPLGVKKVLQNQNKFVDCYIFNHSLSDLKLHINFCSKFPSAKRHHSAQSCPGSNNQNYNIQKHNAITRQF